jgi:hypothetical protein
MPIKSFTEPSTPANELLFKIHTATGWRLPKSEKLCSILRRQLENKLHFDYPGISHDQVETAFLKFGAEENFTGTLCIAQIDKVLRKYFSHQTQQNFDDERRLTTTKRLWYHPRIARAVRDKSKTIYCRSQRK